jgi:hypothetical protein
MQILNGPNEPPTPYAASMCLEAVCSDPSCATLVLIDNPNDVYFASSLHFSSDLGHNDPAIILCWRCPGCGTQNMIEEWLSSETTLPGWPPILTRAESDANPASLLITREARLEALARYRSGH